MAFVPDEWFEELNRHRWFASKTKNTFYACRRERGVRYAIGRGTILMHRVITDCPDGMEVDHKDGDGLNNCLDNLRVVPHVKNTWNKGKPVNNTSGFKGVWLRKSTNKWYSDIWVHNVKHRYGPFADIIDAAKAYNSAALEYHGEFAYQNALP